MVTGREQSSCQIVEIQSNPVGRVENSASRRKIVTSRSKRDTQRGELR